MLKHLNKIFIGICLAIAFFAGKQCGDRTDIEAPIGLRVDTIHTRDTIWPDTIKVYVPKRITKYDTQYVYYEIPPDTVQLEQLYKVRGYERTYRDSNMKVTVKDSILGFLMGQKVDYRLFVPLEIRDTIRIEKVSYKPFKWQFAPGIEATPKNIYFGADLQVNRTIYSGAYDPYNKQVKVGIKYVLFRK